MSIKGETMYKVSVVIPVYNGENYISTCLDSLVNQTLQELEVIVKELESGEVNLDDAIEKYTKAMKLAKECSDKLNKATEKVNKILKENGVLEEFKVEE